MFLKFLKQNKLQPRTLALVEQLFSATWFCHVGEALEGDFYLVKSWAEAVEFLKDPDQIFLEAQGDFTVQLYKLASTRYQKWNDICLLVKKEIESRIDEKVAQIPVDDISCKKIRDRVRWSILHACMESEYSDIVRPGFFCRHAELYLKGRFPCGWHGDYKHGKLAVY